jgi:hypothetical protein
VTDQNLFLKVVLSLSCHLDLEALGLDRHVKMPMNTSGETPIPFTYIPISPHYPTITSAGFDWTLIENIFQSNTSLGRGASVWRVSRTDENRQLVERAMKWSWRPHSRSTESHIHMSILSAFDGAQPSIIALLAQEQIAAQSEACDHPTAVTWIASLREGLLPTSQPVRDLTLTCILLQRLGKPLWGYTNDLEFLRGARNITRGK